MHYVFEFSCQKTIIYSDVIVCKVKRKKIKCNAALYKSVRAKCTKIAVIQIKLGHITFALVLVENLPYCEV